jgi:hypothetical protein
MERVTNLAHNQNVQRHIQNARDFRCDNNPSPWQTQNHLNFQPQVAQPAPQPLSSIFS